MNNESFKGNWLQFKGELKKKWGQLADDDLLEAEGDYEKFLGVVQNDTAKRKQRYKCGPKIGTPSGNRERFAEGMRPPRLIRLSQLRKETTGPWRESNKAVWLPSRPA